MKKPILILFLCLISMFGWGADHFVRDGASGDGSDWTNAWDDLPAILVRGDTYYVADGVYGEYVFNDVESTTLYIYIKKATITVHGTNVGWSDAYGDGQAEFIGTDTVWTFQRDYWDIDGVVGSGKTKSNYGFALSISNCSSTTRLELLTFSTTGIDHFYVKHTYFQGCSSSYDVPQYLLYSNAYNHDANNITVSNNCFYNGSSNMLIRGWSSSTIDNNYFAGNWSSGSNHGTQISVGNECTDITLSNNMFESTAVIVVSFHTDGNADWNIYNNIIFSSIGTASGFRNGDSAVSNVMLRMKFHHNTAYNCTFGGFGFFLVGTITNVGTNKSYAYNNLIYNCSNPHLHNSGHTVGAIENSYSAHFDSTGTYDNDEGGTCQDDTGDPFVSAGSDFHLSAATNNGKDDLGSPFNIDKDGLTRGTDGVWDRGAYEYPVVDLNRKQNFAVLFSQIYLLSFLFLLNIYLLIVLLRAYRKIKCLNNEIIFYKDKDNLSAMDEVNKYLE